MSQLEYELVANVWPITDEGSQVINRFAARAYVMKAGDDVNIAQVLKVLAESDYHSAKQYPIPEQFTIVTDHGDLTAAVNPSGFNEYFAAIVDPALEDLQKSCPDVVGVSMASGQPVGVPLNLRFIEDPYLVVTFLVEDSHGKLSPFRR